MANTDPESSEILWDHEGPPRSRRFGDLYYSKDDGLAEARTVSLTGCGLPEAWRDRQMFRVAELGFGTGLNIVALLDLWTRTRPRNAHLSIFSVEAYPLSAEDARRALARWPELAPIADRLIARWPGRARGFHRMDLPELNATLDLAIMEVADALDAWTGEADAWFLDGFAPALNPAMWRREVIELVAQRSAPGARLGAYTVAGQVRRDLAAAGFAVERKPGFGGKRQRLEARWPGVASMPSPLPRVAVIGGGIAGAALARAFRALGVEPEVFAAPAVGASSSPAALVSPRLDAGLGPQAALFAHAFARATALYRDIEDAEIAASALQLQAAPKDVIRFGAIAGSDLFEPETMSLSSPGETSAWLGEPTPAGLVIKTALVIEPSRVIERWLGSAACMSISSVQSTNNEWRLSNAEGALIARADVVCVAAALSTKDLVGDLPLTAVRGQSSLARGVTQPIATMFGGYVIPTRTGLMFGATHDRGETDTEPCEEDHTRNRETLARALPTLAQKLETVAFEAHTGVRATTTDYLPIAGEIPNAPPGLFTLTGLGSRGFTLAPLLAEHIAAKIMGAPSPLPRALARLVCPARFAERAARRGRH